MSFFNSLMDMAKSEAAQRVMRVVSDTLTKSPTSEEADFEIESITEAQVKKLLKQDQNSLFSCHFDHASSLSYAIFMPDLKCVWKSRDERSVRELCAVLNPLVDLESGRGDRREREQKLVELMRVYWAEQRRQSGFVTIHYAVACGFLEYLNMKLAKDPEVTVTHVSADGRYPLNIAAEYRKPFAMVELLRCGARVSQPDATGRTVAHWAASSDSTTLQILAKSPDFAQCLELNDERGMTPLAYAIKKVDLESVNLMIKFPESVKSVGGQPLLEVLLDMQDSDVLQQILEIVLKRDASVLNQVDGAGRTVLHKQFADHQLLKSMLCICYLKHIAYNVDPRDKTGATPLIAAAIRGDFRVISCFFSHSCNMNAVDREGETALMKAAERDCEETFRMLLVYGANPEDAEGKWKKLAGRVLKKRPVLEKIVKSFKRPPITDRSPRERGDVPKPALTAFRQSAALRKKMQRDPGDLTHLLSLDGGGIRGLIIIEVLMCMEEWCDDENGLMAQFDWIAGTSTGAILALALAKGRSLAEAKRIYTMFKSEVFKPRKNPFVPYQASTLESFLKEEFGEKTTMAQISCDPDRKVFVTTCVGNRSPPELVLLRNFRLPQFPNGSDELNTQNGYKDPAKTLAWSAARCSSAAPTFFTPVDNCYMDGGLMSNNPSLDLLTEVTDYNTALEMTNREDDKLEIGSLLSIGTGIPPAQETETIDLGLKSVFDITKIIKGALHLKSVLVEQVASANGPVVERTRSQCHARDIPFFRFSPPLVAEVKLDETDDVIIAKMLEATRNYMQEQSTQVQDLLKLLIR